jgi:hypothetical protein
MVERDKQQRVPLPGFCQTCGIVPTWGFSVAHGTVSGCVTNCPKCGGEARVIDGTYEAYADRLHLITSPDLPIEIRQALLALVREVHEGKLTPEQAQRKADEISPKFRGFFDFLGWRSNQARAILIGSLVTAGAMIAGPHLGWESNATTQISVDNVQNSTVIINSPDAALSDRLLNSSSLCTAPLPPSKPPGFLRDAQPLPMPPKKTPL